MTPGLVRGIFAVLTLTAACTHGPRPLTATQVAAMQDSVRETLSLFRRYQSTSQWDSLSRLYADDDRFRWVENGVVRYRSAADVRQALARLASVMRIETTYQETEILPIAPGLASVVTRFQTRFGDPAAGGFTFGGAITMTLIHAAEGWRILGGHTSSPIQRTP
jgi:hypothetical protein